MNCMVTLSWNYLISLFLVNFKLKLNFSIKSEIGLLQGAQITKQVCNLFQKPVEQPLWVLAI